MSTEPAGLPVVFETAARIELTEASDWYDNRRAGLGAAFLTEVERITNLLQTHPRAGPALSRRSRQMRLKVFPYAIVYQILPDHIRIIAVAHSHRRANYWKPRER
jgi:mRNA-degrading endonuclease RelE of RelBE toxin-antitoxin system